MFYLHRCLSASDFKYVHLSTLIQFSLLHLFNSRIWLQNSIRPYKHYIEHRTWITKKQRMFNGLTSFWLGWSDPEQMLFEPHIFGVSTNCMNPPLAASVTVYWLICGGATGTFWPFPLKVASMGRLRPNKGWSWSICECSRPCHCC